MKVSAASPGINLPPRQTGRRRGQMEGAAEGRLTEGREGGEMEEGEPTLGESSLSQPAIQIDERCCVEKSQINIQCCTKSDLGRRGILTHLILFHHRFISKKKKKVCYKSINK